ncbi:unnamed protein product [Plutella xylostella]|uniref:(diamondback moth) hypothetical protein n=1 Tax=Plutella xylostella TaxID=51655 RepID=A0A8S4ECF9_PLUXY|nr:unnamed protein product [Plutella xylostella]
MINHDIKFLTSDDSVNVKNDDFKTFKYESKKKSEESVYDQAKRSYCERRGGKWRMPKPRLMRELESKLREKSVVLCEWLSETVVVIVFSSGSIAYLTVNPDTLDLTQILFDRYCIGKLSGQSVTGGRAREPLRHQYMLGGGALARVSSVRDLGVKFTSTLSFSDHIVNICKGMVGYSKIEVRRDLALTKMVFMVFRGWLCNPTVLESIGLAVPAGGRGLRRRAGRLLAVPTARTNLLHDAPLTRAIRLINKASERTDILTCSLELADGARRADRKVSWSAPASVAAPSVAAPGPRVLVWTAAGADPAPWSPAADVRANLHLYQLHGQHMHVVAYHQLENETLLAEVSRARCNMVHIVEQTTSHKNGVTLAWLIFDVPSLEEGVVRLSTHRAGETRASLPAVARAATRYPCGRRLVASCIDGTLHLVQQGAGLTHSVKAGCPYQLTGACPWWRRRARRACSASTARSPPRPRPAPRPRVCRHMTSLVLPQVSLSAHWGSPRARAPRPRPRVCRHMTSLVLPPPRARAPRPRPRVCRHMTSLVLPPPPRPRPRPRPRVCRHMTSLVLPRCLYQLTGARPRPRARAPRPAPPPPGV